MLKHTPILKLNFRIENIVGVDALLELDGRAGDIAKTPGARIEWRVRVAEADQDMVPGALDFLPGIDQKNSEIIFQRHVCGLNKGELFQKDINIKKYLNFWIWLIFILLFVTKDPKFPKILMLGALFRF